MSAVTLSRQGGRKYPRLGNAAWSSTVLTVRGTSSNAPSVVRRRGILTSGVQYARGLPNYGTVAPASGTVRKIRPVMGTSGTLYANHLPVYGSGGAGPSILSIPEALTLAETLFTQLNITLPGESLGVTDALVRQLLLVQPPAEAITLTEILTAALIGGGAFSQSAQDTLSLAETLAAVRQAFQSLADTLPLTENLGAGLTSTNTSANEALGLAESLATQLLTASGAANHGRNERGTGYRSFT